MLLEVFLILVIFFVIRKERKILQLLDHEEKRNKVACQTKKWKAIKLLHGDSV